MLNANEFTDGITSGLDVRKQRGMEIAAVARVDRVGDHYLVPSVILTAHGGCFDLFVDSLCSDPFKAGYCRKLLGDGFDAVFETKDVTKLENDEVPVVREHVSVDKRFVR